MDRLKQQKSMLDAVKVLEHFLKPGLLGNYLWFEAVEVIAFVPQLGARKAARNIFSIYVAESGEFPQAPVSMFLDAKSKKIKGLDGWDFRVAKRPVATAELLASVKQYAQDGTWAPPGQPPLGIGTLTATPPIFCPPDASTEVPLNGVLKNNFWSGSYVVELKDEEKSTLTDLVREESLFGELSEWLVTMLPLEIARVPDRIGNVLFQIPSSALIAKHRRPPSSPVFLHLAWNPDVPARPVAGEYRLEQDGLVTYLNRFEFPVGNATLEVPPASGELRFSVWDIQNQLLLAMTTPFHVQGGPVRFDSTWTSSIAYSRQFKAKGPDGTIKTHNIPLMVPVEGMGRRPRRAIGSVDWSARRILQARMKQLVESRKFLQYGSGSTNSQAEHQRALDDIRKLIQSANQGAIYLWDPYLSANDVLNTLAFCSDGGTELRGLTSAKPSKKKTLSEETGDGSDVEETINREDWIQVQRNVLDNAFTGQSHMRLEYRMSWGVQGSFHDRFLMFPGLGRARTRVWSLGASINHIGAQHCIVQEVAYPEPVLQAFKAFWDQSDQAEHLIWKYS